MPLPQTIIPALKAQIEDVGKLYDQDLVDGYDGVFLEGSHVTEKKGFLRKTMNFKEKRRISHQIRRISTKIDEFHPKFDEFPQNSTNSVLNSSNFPKNRRISFDSVELDPKRRAFL